MPFYKLSFLRVLKAVVLIMIIISELQEYTIHCPLVVYIIILEVLCKIIFAFVLQSSCIRDFIFKGLWRAEFLHFPADWIILGKEGKTKEKVVYVAKSDTEHFPYYPKQNGKRGQIMRYNWDPLKYSVTDLSLYVLLIFCFDSVCLS